MITIAGISFYFDPKNEKELQKAIMTIHEKTKEGFLELDIKIDNSDNTFIINMTRGE